MSLAHIALLVAFLAVLLCLWTLAGVGGLIEEVKELKWQLDETQFDTAAEQLKREVAQALRREPGRETGRPRIVRPH